MNPVDALAQDRRMYYHNTWMRHSKNGIGMMRVDEEGHMRMYLFPNDMIEAEPVKVKPFDLSCWWPRAGAYNILNSAVYISRRSVRSMRKSAVPAEHYHVKWGNHAITNNTMLFMRRGPEHQSLAAAIAALQGGKKEAVAITRDIILTRGDFGELTVIFRGLLAGEYRNGEFIPTFNGSPLAKRVMYKLARME